MVLSAVAPPAPAGPVARIGRESVRPGRDPGERWVLHADAEWSAAHLEDAPDAVARTLLDAVPGAPEAVHLAAHRWRYARVARPLQAPLLSDGRLVAGGDWCTPSEGDVRAGTVAAAQAAGRALAAAVS